MYVIRLNSESCSRTGNYLLALTEPWLLTVWSQSGFGSPCAGKGCSDPGTDTTSEMFKHLRGILQSLISEFLQRKFSILSLVIQSHTINSSCKTNFVDKCSHNLAVSDTTWRLSWFSYCSCARLSADIVRGLGFWQLCFFPLTSVQSIFVLASQTIPVFILTFEWKLCILISIQLN